jgi:hypothetical protein
MLWPKSFDRVWRSLRERHGRQEGTRKMIELLELRRQHGWQELRKAIEQAFALA